MLKDKNISQLAYMVSKDWKKVNYAAKPYLEAMYGLDTINDTFMFDSGKDIVLRFLCNASAWRGETAKAVKAELKSRVGVK